jgi:hypothetical protein
VARTCRHARLAAPSASARPLVAHWTSEGWPWCELVRVVGEADENDTVLRAGHDAELLEQTQLVEVLPLLSDRGAREAARAGAQLPDHRKAAG